MLEVKDYNNVRVYYFGCITGSSAGHYMQASKHQPDVSQIDRRRTHAFVYDNPWGAKVDSGLCIGYNVSKTFGSDQTEGRALVHHIVSKAGVPFTALAFWDRSVDDRKGSNSVFIAGDNCTFDEMIALAKFHFPHVMARFKFEIVDITPKVEEKKSESSAIR